MPEVLHATLDHVSLASVLQLVEAEAHCGEVRLGETAAVQVANGRIVDARFGAHRGRTALFESFLVEGGPIVVDAGDQMPEGSPLGDTASLILVGCRLVDDWLRIRSLHVARVEDEEVDDDALAALLPHLGVGSLARVVARAGVARTAAVDPILNGLESGWLEEVERDESPEAPPEDLDVDELLDRARDRYRARDFDAAEQALTRALELSPGHRIAAQNLARIRTLRSRSPDRAA